MAEVKFCGLTREVDAEQAGRLGARFAGVIFAGGPRALTPAAAAAVLDAAGPAVRRVGVFGAVPAGEILRAADRARLDVLQLHADTGYGLLRALRARTACELWGVVRLDPATVPSSGVLDELAADSDGLVVDARVPGALGGTGVCLPWDRLAPALAPWRARVRIVLAGGLAPENVAEAVRAAYPDVVDVSSGVEAAPGRKDHARMRAFAAAAGITVAAS